MHYGFDKPRILPSHSSLEEILTSFIPDSLPVEHRTNKRYFTRSTKLTAQQAIGFVLSSVASGRKNGIRGQVQHFFTDHCICPVLSDYQHIHFSNVQKSRYKISDSAFQQIFSDLVDSVYTNWEDTSYNFCDMAVVAFDGSQYTLPGSEKIRKKFDENTPILTAGGRFFPQALVMTAFDVFRKIPVGRTISHTKGSEREELLKMTDELLVKTLAVLDRGYYGYEVFCRIIYEMDHEFLAKVPMKSSFKEVEEFVATGKKHGFITIDPTGSYLKNVKSGKAKMVKNLVPITVRVIRTSIGDDEFILMTSLLDEKKYSTNSLIKLYQARWEVENYYRDEKMWLEVENFMTKSVLGVKQELFAAMIMSIITRVTLYVEERQYDREGEPQYFNAITAIAKAVPKIIALGIEKAKIHISNLLKSIVAKRYYKSTKFRSYLRVSRKPQNKWKTSALKKIAMAV